jgi:hypothetical protein
MSANLEMIRGLVRHGEAEIEQRRRAAAIGMERAIAQGKRVGNPELSKARQTSIAVRKGNARKRYEEFERQLALAYADGATTLREIAAFFKAVGFKTSQGRKWKTGNIARVIEIIEALKAADHVGSIAPDVIGNDDAGFSTSTANRQPELLPRAGGRDVDAMAAANENEATRAGGAVGSPNSDEEAAPAGAFALSPEQFAEFRYLAEVCHNDTETKRKYIAVASSPTLSKTNRTAILAWIAKKRAVAA